MGKVINVQMDEDFYNKVIQGEGSGNGSSESVENQTYYDLTKGNPEDSSMLGMYFPNLSCIARYEKDNEIAIAPYNILVTQGKSAEYIQKYAIDLNIKMVIGIDTITIGEMFSMNGFDLSPYSITKEQFYSLE